MNVVFVSDLHLGHRNILTHAEKAGTFRGGTNVEEHDAWIIERCLSINPSKRTLWYFLGDVAMEEEKLCLLDELPGRKILLPGNHDLFPTETYLKHFESVRGSFKKYKMWISHIPVHPLELRGLANIHGHCHHNTTGDDPRYFNCAIEWLPENRPISLDEIRESIARRDL